MLKNTVKFDGFHYLTDNDVSLNILSNPYQEEVGFRQGHFKIEYSQDETTVSVHVPPDALKGK